MMKTTKNIIITVDNTIKLKLPVIAICSLILYFIISNIFITSIVSVSLILVTLLSSIFFIKKNKRNQITIIAGIGSKRQLFLINGEIKHINKFIDSHNKKNYNI
jgi:hypothetical protein